MEEILKFIPASMAVLIPIAVGWGLVLKSTEPEDGDSFVLRLFKVHNWVIPYYLLVISWINAAVIQFKPDFLQWFIVGQIVAFFSKFGYDIFIKPIQNK
jgi:hypothetical protein